MDYPASKEYLVTHAVGKDADDEVLTFLRGLTDRNYETPAAPMRRRAKPRGTRPALPRPEAPHSPASPVSNGGLRSEEVEGVVRYLLDRNVGDYRSLVLAATVEEGGAAGRAVRAPGEGRAVPGA